MIQSYVHNPLPAQAVQWDGTNIDELLEFIDLMDGPPEDEATFVDWGGGVTLNLFMGELRVRRWDYLVLTGGGSLYTFDEAAFNKIYSLAPKSLWTKLKNWMQL